MNHVIASLFRRNRRAFVAALLSYLLLAGQTAPLVLASAARTAAPSAASPTAPPAGETSSPEVTAAAPEPAPLAPAAAFVPTITATKVDTVIAANGVDPDPDGIADPDQLIEYQVTITNNGTAATNVTFNDTVDANTTLQSGTVRSTPLAAPDAYNVLGNVRINVPDGSSDLLNNDQDPDTGNNTDMTVVAETKKSAQCGSCATDNVTINADGSFSYDPPPGYTGPDSFTYTPVSQGDNGSAGTVNLTITGMIWFIDNSQATNGDGRLSSPFNNLASFAAINDGVGNHPAADDNIFLYRQVATDYTGGTPLLSGQKLVGQGATAPLATITGVTVPPHSAALPSTSGTNPVIVNAAGNDITIAAGSTGNLLRGVSFGNASGSAIASGAGFGTLTISEVSVNTTGQALNLNTGTLSASFGALTSGGGANNINLASVGGTLTNVSGSLSESTGPALNVTGGNAAITYNGNITNDNGQRGISVSNPTGGSLNVAGTVTVSGTGASNDAIVIDGNDANAYAATISAVSLNTNSMDDGIVLRDLVAGSSVTVNGGSVTSQGAGRRAVDFESENTAGTFNLSGVSFDNSTGDGFLFGSGQTGTYSLGATTVNTPNGTNPAVTVNGSSAAVTFASISETGGTNGLNITGATGSFTVTGALTLGTNAARITTAAVALTNNTAPINLGTPSIFAGASGIGGTNNSGTITVSNGVLNVNAGPALNITGPAGRTPLAMTFIIINSSNSGTNGINLDFVSGNLTVDDTGVVTIVSNSTGNGLQIQNSTATFNFNDTTNITGNGNGSANAPGTGVFLNANSGALNFNDLDISPDSQERGLHATSNTGTLTTTSGDIITGTGTAVEIVGTSSGSRAPLNMTLNKVSANGAPNGIILTNTNGPGASVGFVVNGDGSNTTVGGNASGGLIQNTAGGDDATPADAGGIGVRLNFADEVVLRRMTLTTQANYAIYGENSSNFTFEFSTINGSNGTASGIGAGEGDASVAFSELTGAALVKDSNISGTIEDQFRVVNTTGTLNRLVFNNVTFGAMDATLGDDAMNIQAKGNAVINLTVQDSDINSARGDILGFTLGNTVGTTASGDLIFDNNTVNNQHPQPVTAGGGVSLVGGGAADANNNLTYEFDNNTFRGARGDALLILWQTGAGSSSGRIEGNTFGVSGVDKSCSTEARCIEIRTEGRGAHTTLINNNQIRQYASEGIYFEMDGINTAGSTGTIGSLNATVTNNLIEQPNTAAVTHKNGIHLNHGATAGDNYSSCLDIKTNTTGSAGSETSIGQDIILRQRLNTTVRLPGYAGASDDDAAVEAFIAAQNTGAESVNALSDAPATGGGFVGGAACAQPPAGAVIFNGSNLSGSSVSGGFGSFTDGQMATGAGGGTPAGASSFGGGVTSQPIVTMPLGTTQTTSAQPTNTLAPVPQQQQAVTPAEPQGAITDAGLVAPANPPVITGNNINWNLGTLQQGQSVTITFRVKVNNPYGGGPNVSNQGSVNCTECAGPVLTDDPGTVAANDATLTPVNAQPDIVVSDASGPEPPSGSSPMAFTVVLSKPSATDVTVNFTTAEDTNGTDPATEGVDFTPTSGQLTFTPGQTVQTISVHVLADADAPEPDETFLVQLTGATGGNITDNEAVGTITNNNPAGAILISEIRTFGPSGATQAGDDFVEIYNNSNSPHTVADGSGINDAAHGYGLFRLGATCADTPVLIGIIPNGTVIPARGHYLFVGSQYSLTTSASGDQTMTSDLPENANVGIFKTPSVANLSTATRLDAVGFSPNTTGNNCDLLREGGALPQVISGTAGLGQHSFYRSLCSFVNGVGCTVANPGFPEDRNSNATDFLFVDTAMTNAAGAGQQRLGAPGPENFGSARVNDNVGVFMLDASKSSSAAPNRVRKQCADAEECLPNRSSLGTMSIRRRFINNTAATVTQLRVRVAELTTFPRLNAATADVRPITSTDVSVGGINDPSTCGAAPLPCTVTVKGTTVQGPAQPNGGGYNTTMIVTLPGGGLPVGQSISLQFMLGVQESGSFRFLLNVEALP